MMLGWCERWRRVSGFVVFEWGSWIWGAVVEVFCEDEVDLERYDCLFNKY